jgi:ribonuclease PH
MRIPALPVLLTLLAFGAQAQVRVQEYPLPQGITGAFVALHDAIALLMQRGLIAESPVRDFVAAVSVGMVGGAPVLDLDYAEDSTCDTDMNVVMTGAGGFVEVQGTAEGAPFSQTQMDALMGLAQTGIRELIAKQKAALGIS